LSHRSPKVLPVLAALLLSAFVIAGCSSEGDTQDRDSQDGSREQNVAQNPPDISSSDAPDDEPVARVADQLRPSVVQINVQAVQQTPYGPQQGEGVGSGVIYRQDGYIITNNHVVEGAESVEIGFASGDTATGQVVGGDPFTDIAVVQVDRGDLPAASFNAGQSLDVGQLAVAIGSPQGFDSTVTAGVVSGLGREVPAQLTGGTQEASLVDLVQTDAAISPGSSGGALVDRAGEVIGINVAYLPPAQTGAESIGFAIPAQTAVETADQIISTGEASNAYLGVSLTDVSQEIAEQFDTETGALVEQSRPGEPAAQGGIRRGDIITAIEGSEIQTTGDLLSELRRYQPGDTVEMTVVRNGDEELTSSVTLGERSEFE
jgi:S1-C subfamily serine protease